jgi:hypothetical protein
MRNETSIEWTKETFQFLEEFWRQGENGRGLGNDEYSLIGRYAEVMCMLERDGIWPPPMSPQRHKFCAALREALCRLPQKAFDEVDNQVRFLLDDPSLQMFAVNAPAPPSADLSGRPGIDTIIFFRTCMDLSLKALVGLIAHEIAHSFVCCKDYAEDEILAENKTRAWGFGAELDCLKSEKERLIKSGSTPAIGGQIEAR